MLIARAFSGFPTWIKLYINSCEFLENIVNILSDFLPENCEVATAIDEV